MRLRTRAPPRARARALFFLLPRPHSQPAPPFPLCARASPRARMETLRLDSSALKPSEVLVKMLAAPITAVDLAQIAGSASYPSGSGAAAPAGGRVCGSEGVGVVLEAATGSGLAKGDIVTPNQGGLGTWATHVVAPGGAWAKVAADASALGAVESVAAGIAPVIAAGHLLDGFVKLEKGAWAAAPRLPGRMQRHFLTTLSLSPFCSAGDVVVLNDGGNLVSQAVVQLAAARGVKTLSLLREGSGPAFASLSPHLTALGASLVCGEDAAASHAFKKSLADFKGAVLGLNASGGAAALATARALAPRGTLVTYGAAARGRAAIAAPLDLFTAADLTLRGYSLTRWAAAAPKEARDKAVAAAFAAVAGAQPAVRLLVAREPFADFAQALKRVGSAGNERPVVLLF